MPCYDPRGSPEYINKELSQEINDLKESRSASIKLSNAPFIDRINKLEASLCALLTKLDEYEIFNEVLECASREGLIDLTEFWEKHGNEDQSRLKTKMHKDYSEQEQKKIYEMLKDKYE